MFCLVKKNFYIGILLALFVIVPKPLWAQVSALEAALDTDDGERYSPWAFSGFSLSSLGIDQAAQGGASLGTYSYLSAHYRMEKGTRFSIRLPFSVSTPGFDKYTRDEAKSSEFLFQDIILGYTNTNLILLPGELEVFWEIRAYLPTSKSSQDQKQILRFRNDFIVSKSFTKHLEMEYFPKLSYYYQTNTTYFDPNGNLNNTKFAELDHWITLWYKISPTFNLGWQFGGEDEWYNQSKSSPQAKKQQTGNLSRHIIKSGPSVRFSVSSAVSLILTLQNKIPIAGFGKQNSPISNLGKFNADQTEVAMLAFMGF